MKVMAELEVGMKLVKSKSRTWMMQTVCDELIVTAVGEQGFLAKDTEGKEHHFYEGHCEHYEAVRRESV